MTEDEATQKAQQEARAELEICRAAEDALGNAAIVAYFDGIEGQAIDALLDCDPLDPDSRLALTVVAQTVRKLKSYLHEKRDLRAFVEAQLKDLDKEDSLDD